MNHDRKEWLWSLTLSAALLFVACRPPHGADNPDPESPSSTGVVVETRLLADGAMVTIPTLDFTIPAGVGAATALEGAVVPVAPRSDLRTWQLSPTERSVLYATTEGAVEWIAQLEELGYCESQHSPGAIGDNGASRGWFQIQRLWFDGPAFADDPIDWEQAFDPAVNLRVALRIVRYQLDRGQPPFAQWTCARGW